jgi:predicted membrane channel-forming protein YqfA (hemolysin III family)
MKNERGISALGVMLIIAAAMIAIVFVFLGQWFFVVILAIAVIVGLAALFARSRTPVD